MTGTEARELRAQIRHWRRGRSDAKIGEVLQDAYIGVFATLMLGAMIGNVVLQSRRVIGGSCASAGCDEARSLLPWLLGLATLLGVVGVARLFGPVFVSPAAGTWLVAAPVDRATLLRPRLLVAFALAALVTAPVALASAALAGFGAGALVGFSLAAAVLALGLVAAGALSQVGNGRLGTALVRLLGLGTWAGLVLLALGDVPRAAPPRSAAPPVVAGIAVLAAVALATGLLARRRLAAMRRERLAGGGALAPGLSGALASLDLALVYDVLVAHRWRGHGVVRSRRGGWERPGAVPALVWLDVVRLRRTPSRVVVLAAASVLPYAAATAGAGRVSLLLGALVGFLAGLPFLVALRVVNRTPSIARALPVPDSSSRGATVVVPGVLLGLFGLAGTGAVHEALHVPVADAGLLALAVGGAGLAGAVRWVTGRPPDYTRPLVSTPAGGVPTNLYGSVVRGFDMVLVCTAPMLLLATQTGALLSLGLSAIVVGYLVNRE